MPVVINNFEVVTEPPTGTVPPAGAGVTPTAQPPATAALSPHDIERILRHQAERQARIWAH